MIEESKFALYKGDGTTLSARNLRLPLYEKIGALDDPAGYLAEKGLRDAVNVALTLGQPLLLTGEPGTGKMLLEKSLGFALTRLNPCPASCARCAASFS